MSDTVADRDAAPTGPAVDDEVSPDAATAAAGSPRPLDRVTRTVDRVVARGRAEPSLVVLWIAVAVWFAVFATLVWRRHEYFATFDFDLGHHDQAVWLLSRGTGFITVSGMPVFGHHLTLAYLALVPFYWLGGGPQLLNLIQNAALAVAAVPIYLYARDRLTSPWLGTALGVAWLLNPSVQWLSWETWHPETVAIPFLMFAFLMASRRRWTPYWILLVAAMSWKEDIALAVAMFGLVLLVRGERRVALFTILLAAIWFVIAYGIVMPHFNGGLNHAGTFYGELGSSPTEIARTALEDPTQIYRRLEGNDAVGYGRDLLAPFGFVPLLAPVMLLVAVPQFFANALANQTFFFDIHFHYVAVILAVFAFATVEGVARFRQPGAQRFLTGGVAACALAASVAWGLSPISTDYRLGYWPLGGNARQATLEAAVDTVPGDAAVSANYYLVPHLSHRRQIYTFPNPWFESNWGVRLEDGTVEAPHDPDHDHVPAEVEWLVVDRQVLGPGSREMILLDTLLGNGEFQVVTDDEGVVVARRVEPPVTDPTAEQVAEAPPSVDPATDPTASTLPPLVTTPDAGP